MSDPRPNPTNLRKYAKGDFSIRGGLMRRAADEIERLREDRDDHKRMRERRRVGEGMIEQRRLAATVELIHADRDLSLMKTRMLRSFTAMAWLITVIGLICLVAVSW